MKYKMGIILVATAVMSLHLSHAATLIDGYVNSAEVKLGQWNYNFSAVKQYADEHHVPLLMFYGSTTCGYCDGMINNGLNSTVFRNWVKEHPICMVFQDKSSLTADPAKNFVKAGQATTHLPYMKIYWSPASGATVEAAFSGRKGEMPSTVGAERGEQLVNSLNKVLADYLVPQTPVSVFAVGKTEGDRLECEDGTTSVQVPIVRTVNVSGASEDTLYVDGVAQKIKWVKDQTQTNVTIAVKGATVALQLKDSTGKVTDTTSITYVKREVSAANPLWIGETFGFGEWTCDIDAAKAKVAAVDGNAYTLVSIQGSMWCPDCANTDRNFLEATDKSGANRFCAWAKSKNIALVSMDIPNYTGSSVTDRKTPTLFATNAYATTLARAREYPQSGAPAELTNAVVRSGLGYMSRKGVTAAQAEAQLVKFHDLASKNTDAGGFHRPEDGNKNRTGVPIFVLLRQDGSVAARFTRFASVSPMAADQANFDNYIKRFEEMLAIADATGDHADATEIENNYPGAGAMAFAANGGTAKGELCHADMRDAFKLEGVRGNADQKVTVKGTTTAAVSVQFWRKNAAGIFEAIGQTGIGRLSDGITLTQTFTESGDYYLLVMGTDVTSAEFEAASATAEHFHSYTVTGATVLVPQGDWTEAEVPSGSDKVVIRLDRDVVYCFSNVTTNDNPFLVEVGTMGAYKFVKSIVSGDCDVVVAGRTVGYQLWQPGQVGFVETSRTVPESINDLDDDWVEFDVARTDGKSGRVKVRVTIDQKKTTLPSERYIFQTNAPNNAVDFVWEDGVTSNMTVRVKIDDDMLYTGDNDIVFNLEILSSDAGDVTIADGKGAFTLTVVEDDKAEPGRALVSRTTPVGTTKKAVYVRESEGAKIWVKRIEAFDGLVAAELVSSLKGVEYATENPRDLTNGNNRTWVYWSNHEWQEKYVQVTGIPAGKSARIDLKSFGNFKTVSGSNTVTVVAVADDAPAFSVAVKAFMAYRYVTVSDLTVAADASTLKGGTVSLSKIAGTLPGGIKVVWDDAAKALTFQGTPTGKPGTYTVSYQIVEKRGQTKVPGLLTTVTLTVLDPTDTASYPGANPTVGATRTFKGIPVVNKDKLVGVLQLTIPRSGHLSAKYTCIAGTIPFSASSWGSFDPEERVLAAKMSCRHEGYSMSVNVLPDGSVVASLMDPEYTVSLDAVMDWKPWSKSNTAEAWAGYYTIALPVETNAIVETTENFAPRGCGYLTAKMQTKSATNSGTMTWAGMLPNGTAVSGSVALAKPMTKEDGLWANLPVFTTSSRDCFSAYVRIMAEAQEKESRRCVLAALNEYGLDMTTWWIHLDKANTADFALSMIVCGSYFDEDEDLLKCCKEYYQTSDMLLGFGIGKLVDTYYGAPEEIAPLKVKVESDTIALVAKQENPADVTLRLNRSTGIVTGSFDLTCGSREISASYRGVVLMGWGEGCGCGDFDVYRPFVNGSFYFTDTIDYDGGKTASVKRGGEASVYKE